MKRRGHQPKPGDAQALPASGSGVPPVKPPGAVTLRMRLSAGKYAINAAEAEVHLSGARIAGGNGSFEFDLARECWVDIVVLRS